MTDHVVPTLTPSFLREHATSARRLSAVEQLVAMSYEASALDALDYGRECVRLAQSNAERTRRQAMARRRAIVEDNWRDLVYSDLKTRLRAELHSYVMGPHGEYCDISRNPAKNIWQETAVLYKSPAARETPAKPDDAELYRRLTRGTKFNSFWAAVEYELPVYNDLVIWPTVVELRGRRVLRHNKAAGDTVTAIYDPELGGQAEPYALVFVDSWSDGTRARERYFWWTPQWRAIFDDDADLTRLDQQTLAPIDDDDKNAPSFDNPYGRMIFTYLHVDPHRASFWNQTSGEDLIGLTLKTARQQTQTADLFNRSGHKQIVATGTSIRQGEKTLLDTGALIKVLGDGVSAQLVDWTIDFESRQRVIDNDEARAAASYGINPERLRKTSYQTAEGARLTERPLEERRAKTREPFCDAERDYRRDLIRVCEVDRPDGVEELPDPNVWMEVTHAPIAYPGDPKQQLDVDAAEISLGIISPVEVIQRRYPGISRDEALKRLRDNLQDAAEVARIKQQFNMADDPRNRGADDEQNGRRGPEVRDGQTDSGQPDPGSPPGHQPA